MGNWSAPMQRYHELVRGKGMRRMMREHGLTVYLIDEYKMSKCCPACCTGMLKLCKMQRNPLPVGSGSGSGHALIGDSNCSGSDPWEGDGDLQPGSGDHALIGDSTGDQREGDSNCGGSDQREGDSNCGGSDQREGNGDPQPGSDQREASTYE
ncbi:hypothetical protein LPJ61_001430 [Coemansia biformis]|uniref:Uncharacterized protein n=1 Tax=Coemansia biformis TaxID=1286918 RepID=A0A9W7YGX1_9FUNG|nr:hypothetical protein LPJ61_001430 [Coemansia biformis]